MQFAQNTLLDLLAAYGYLAVFLFIAIESTGIPFPGETMLITASIYAGHTHRLNIVLVIAFIKARFVGLEFMELRDAPQQVGRQREAGAGEHLRGMLGLGRHATLERTREDGRRYQESGRHAEQERQQRGDHQARVDRTGFLHCGGA